MADFSYTTVPGKIGSLLGKIRGVGIPPKATVQWMKQVGFTSSNDNTLLAVLKQVGLIDGLRRLFITILQPNLGHQKKGCRQIRI